MKMGELRSKLGMTRRFGKICHDFLCLAFSKF
jgi:hypothetical protein